MEAVVEGAVGDVDGGVPFAVEFFVPHVAGGDSPFEKHVEFPMMSAIVRFSEGFEASEVGGIGVDGPEAENGVDDARVALGIRNGRGASNCLLEVKMRSAKLGIALSMCISEAATPISEGLVDFGEILLDGLHLIMDDKHVLSVQKVCRPCVFIDSSNMVITKAVKAVHSRPNLDVPVRVANPRISVQQRCVRPQQ